MGWREVIIQTVWDYTGCTDARAETTAAGIEDRLADMPPSDRIDLARELLAGTGWEVMDENSKQMMRAVAYTDGYGAAWAEVEAR
jgi:hypothetical protein